MESATGNLRCWTGEITLREPCTKLTPMWSFCCRHPSFANSSPVIGRPIYWTRPCASFAKWLTSPTYYYHVLVTGTQGRISCANYVLMGTTICIFKMFLVLGRVHVNEWRSLRLLQYFKAKLMRWRDCKISKPLYPPCGSLGKCMSEGTFLARIVLCSVLFFLLFLLFLNLS